jgi:hypothetical protein
MPQGPMGLFGWLMNVCVSEDRAARSRDALSEAVVFASGVGASMLTFYFAGLYHII